MRGKAARKNAAEQAREDLKQAKKVRENSAATKLQAIGRGKKAREEAQTDLANKRAEAQAKIQKAKARKGRADALASALALIADVEKGRLHTMDPELQPKKAGCVHALCRCMQGAGLAAFGPSAEATEAAQLNDEGLRAHTLGKSQEALEKFTKAAKKQPWRSRYMLSTANMYLKLDAPEAARVLYEWILSVSSLDAEHAVAEAKLKEAQS